MSALSATYDAGADILYITKRQLAAVRGVGDRNGIVWRYDGDDDLIGATVTDFREHWSGQEQVLAAHLSARFNVPGSAASSIISGFAEVD